MMFCKSSHIMFRFSENLFPCHLRELHARSLTVCLSLLLTPTLALHEHVRVSLSLPPSPSSLSFFLVRIYMHTFPLSYLTHKRSAAVTCRWLLSEFLSDCFQNRKCFARSAQKQCFAPDQHCMD